MAKRERTATHAKPRHVYELQHTHKQCRARKVAAPATPGSTRDASHPGGSKYGNMMHRHGVQASLRITPRTQSPAPVLSLEHPPLGGGTKKPLSSIYPGIYIKAP